MLLERSIHHVLLQENVIGTFTGTGHVRPAVEMPTEMILVTPDILQTVDGDPQVSDSNGHVKVVLLVCHVKTVDAHSEKENAAFMIMNHDSAFKLCSSHIK